MATETQLLELLDYGEDLPPSARAVLLAHASTGSEHAANDVASLPVGARDRLILLYRAQLFGARMDGRDRCPQCGETVTFVLDSQELAASGSVSQQRTVVHCNGYTVTCRPPCSTDVLAAEQASTAQEARRVLLAATVLHAQQHARAVDPAELPGEVINAIGRALAEADQLAEISFGLSCDTCGATWDTLFDVADFVWQELRDWGRRLQLDVHQLGTAYGWSEAETLAVPARRRAVYLKLAADA